MKRRLTHKTVGGALAIAAIQMASAGTAAAQPADRPRVASDAQAQPQPKQEARDARPVIVGADGTLTVTASAPGLPLSVVLNAIAAHQKFGVVLSDTLEREHVSQSLRAVPVEDGLKQLLAKYDAFYLYSATDAKSPGAIQAIWVFRRGEGRELQPVPPTAWASTSELADQLEDPDPAVRAETFESLIERLGVRGLDMVLRGLADPDESVRLTAISAAVNGGVEIPTADLHAVLLSDQSYAVRRVALDAIEGRPEAKSIAESLVDDPDEHIRTHARHILEPPAAQNQRRPPPR
jgi:hypothetical protein